MTFRQQFYNNQTYAKGLVRGPVMSVTH